MLRNTSCEQLDFFQLIDYHRIPKKHILLQIDSEISLAFINDLLSDKYNKTFGRPAWKPEVMIRIGILQRMYDLSDEAVIDEIAVNRAFEYFCHLSPMDELPHTSTLCKFRKMQLEENTMDEILTEIVRQMLEKGIIKKESGIIIDSTHITANTIKKVSAEQYTRFCVRSCRMTQSGWPTNRKYPFSAPNMELMLDACSFFSCRLAL